MSTVYVALCPAEYKQIEAHLTSHMPHAWNLIGPKTFSSTPDQAIMRCMRIESRSLREHLSFDVPDHPDEAAQTDNMDDESGSIASRIEACHRARTVNQAVRHQARRIGTTTSRDLLKELVLLSVPLSYLPEAQRSIHAGQLASFHIPLRIITMPLTAGAYFHKVVLSCFTADGTTLKIQPGKRFFCGSPAAVGTQVLLYEDPVHCVLCNSAAVQKDVSLSQILVMTLFEFTAADYELDPCFSQAVQPFPHYMYTVQDFVVV